MGKVLKKVAIGVGFAAAAVFTAGAAIPGLLIPAGATIAGLSAATVFGGLAAASLMGVQYLMKPTSSGAGMGNYDFAAQTVGAPPTPIRKTLRQPDAARSLIFGRVRTSGIYFFYETDQAKNLYMGIYLCDGPVSAFDGFYCDDEGFTPVRSNEYGVTDGNANVYVPKDGLKWIKAANYSTQTLVGFVNGWPIYSYGGGSYKLYECAAIAFEPINGTVTGASSYILNTLMPTVGYSADLDSSAAFSSNLAGIWSASHLAKGATVLYTYNSTSAFGNANRMKYFPNAWPEWAVLIRGCPVHDARAAGLGVRYVDVGTGTNSGTTVTLTTAPAIPLQVGMGIDGVGVAAGTTITSITNPYTFVVSSAPSTSPTTYYFKCGSNERISVGNGSISGTALTLTRAPQIPLQIGDIIYGTNVKSGTMVTAVASATSYTVSISQAVASTAITTWSMFNPSWGYSENPALIAAHFINWLISRNATAILGVNWTDITFAAGLCDEYVLVNRSVLGNSTTYEPFAAMSGVYYFNTPPREFLANIMASCDGGYGIDNNGLFTMWIGYSQSATVEFTENDISSFTEDFVEAATDAVNEIHINYTEPRQQYQRVAAPTYVDQDSINQVGRKTATMNFDMVTSPNQAYRLAARHAKRVTGKKRLTLTLGPRGMLAVKQRVISLNCPTYLLFNTWRVESLVPDANLTRWTATLREDDSSIYANVVAPEDPIKALTVVKPPPGASAQNTASTALIAPYNFYYGAYQFNATYGGFAVDFNFNYNRSTNPVPYSLVDVCMVKDETLEVEVQYATSSNGGSTWSAWLTATRYMNRYRVDAFPINRGRLVKFRCRRFALDGSVSDWTTDIQITIP